jgi:hypothetical protein
MKTGLRVFAGAAFLVAVLLVRVNVCGAAEEELPPAEPQPAEVLPQPTGDIPPPTTGEPTGGEPAVAVPEPAAEKPAAVVPPPEPPAERAAPRFTPPEPPPEWGVLLRGGYFGLPDLLAGKIFRQHPAINGFIYGVEFRYHGDGGPRGIASVGLGVDYGIFEGDGIWQTDEFDEPMAVSGKITMTAATVTGYWNIFPSWWVHPYLGVGIGAAYLKGEYRKDSDLIKVETWFPAVHIPVGLALELGDHFQITAEARFIDGIALGGSLQGRF